MGDLGPAAGPAAGPAEANARAAADAVRAALRAGVRTFCVCPGGRNAPWVELLDRLGNAGTVEFVACFEERAAAFFALGRAKRDLRPVAVCTTSGTAVAELLPAFVEARHAGVPLWALTADRPHRFRGTGAPQTIEQIGLLAGETDHVIDLDFGASGSDPVSLPPAARRVHWNVCFEEPLLSSDVRLWEALVASLRAGADDIVAELADSPPADDAVVLGLDRIADSGTGDKPPLVVVGGLPDAADVDAVARWVERLGAPVLADASSHLRAHALVSPRLLRGGEELAREALRKGCFSSVVRFGGVPSFRLWRDLEGLDPRPPVLSVARSRFPGLSGAVQHACVACIPPPSSGSAMARRQGFLEELFRRDAERARVRRLLRERFPCSEPALVAAVAAAVPERAFVYLGNSLPVREWASDAEPEREARLRFDENRGANGIDGQLSSYFGAVREDCDNFGLFGDLTALYDLSAPWMLRALGVVARRVRVVIIHNGGGQIFAGMFANQRFRNSHATPFEPWARMWGLEYARAESAAEVSAALRRWEVEGASAACVLEVHADPKRTAEFRRHWAAAIAAM